MQVSPSEMWRPRRDATSLQTTRRRVVFRRPLAGGLAAAADGPYRGAIARAVRTATPPREASGRPLAGRSRSSPWWLRAYLAIGALQGLAIGLTGLASPPDVVGFPLQT